MNELLNELSKHNIYLCDVFGGRMWHDTERGTYSWDIDEMIFGFSSLNCLTYNLLDN